MEQRKEINFLLLKKDWLFALARITASLKLECKNLHKLLQYELNMCVQYSVCRHFSGARLYFEETIKVRITCLLLLSAMIEL